MLVKYLKEYNGHQPGTYDHLEDVNAAELMRRGIVESADGTEPQTPHNFRFWPR